MKELIKKILIVDDSQLTSLKIDNYEQIFKKKKQLSNGEIDYGIEFVWESSIDSALKILDDKTEVFHVLLIDYQFNNDENNLFGTDLVEKIRKTINKKCKIIFYTMNGYDGIEKKDYIKLINNDIFRFYSKSGELLGSEGLIYGNENADESIVNGMIDAINEADPITLALEKFFVQYFDILKDKNIKVEGKDYKLNQILDSIRLDIEPGRVFVNKMLRMAILDCVDFLE